MRRSTRQFFVALCVLTAYQTGVTQTAYDTFESTGGADLKRLRTRLEQRLQVEARGPFARIVKLMETERQTEQLIRYLDELSEVRKVALNIRTEWLRIDATGNHGAGSDALDLAQKIERLDVKMRSILRSGVSVSSPFRLQKLDHSDAYRLICQSGQDTVIHVDKTRHFDPTYCGSVRGESACDKDLHIVANHLCSR